MAAVCSRYVLIMSIYLRMKVPPRLGTFLHHVSHQTGCKTIARSRKSTFNCRESYPWWVAYGINLGSVWCGVNGPLIVFPFSAGRLNLSPFAQRRVSPNEPDDAARADYHKDKIMSILMAGRHPGPYRLQTPIEELTTAPTEELITWRTSSNRYGTGSRRCSCSLPFGGAAACGILWLCSFGATYLPRTSLWEKREQSPRVMPQHRQVGSSAHALWSMPGPRHSALRHGCGSKNPGQQCFLQPV